MINIAILGFGVVGGGVYEVIKQNGLPVTVKHILDKRTFPGHDLENAVTTDFSAIIDDPRTSFRWLRSEPENPLSQAIKWWLKNTATS